MKLNTKDPGFGSGYFWRQSGALLWGADSSLGKLILAPKRCLAVEVGSGLLDPEI